MRADTRLPPYLPYPRFLLQADLTQTAKLLYALLLDRATLSQANGWLDEGGRIYLVFPIEKIAAVLNDLSGSFEGRNAYITHLCRSFLCRKDEPQGGQHHLPHDAAFQRKRQGGYAHTLCP